MNAKFKMPKFGRNLSSNGVLKELLLTTIGTTISIVLTFGTAHYVEQQQADKSRRLLAMTIINDIDQSLNITKRLIELEEEGRTVSFHLLDNIDRLDSIPSDTLYMFINYVMNGSFDSKLEFKKNNEEIFNSSQDSWRTLNDRKFLNNVQNFYNARAVFERQTKEWMYFRKPITTEEEYNIVMVTDEVSTREKLVPLCRRLLESPRMRKYIESFGQRKNLYRGFLEYVNLNEENKFLMNITEQDMEDFVNQTYMTIRPVKDQDLVGTWEAVMPDDKRQISFEFRKDHTFTTHQSFSWTHPAFRGKLVQRFTLSGKWAIEGDSLVKHFDMKSYQLKLEEVNVVSRSGMADDLEKAKAELTGDVMKPAIVKRAEQNNRIAQGTNLDKSGTRMELTEPDSNPVHYQKKMEK